MIPAEAVEAAARALVPTVKALQPVFAEADMGATIDLNYIARLALEAAAPYMLAAWERDRDLEDKADEARREWVDDKEEYS